MKMPRGETILSETSDLDCVEVRIIGDFME